METKITLIEFYPYHEWFWYYRKNKFIKGFTLRLLGINFMRKDKDSFNQLIRIHEIHKILRKNKVDYK